VQLWALKRAIWDRRARRGIPAAVLRRAGGPACAKFPNLHRRLASLNRHCESRKRQGGMREARKLWTMPCFRPGRAAESKGSLIARAQSGRPWAAPVQNCCQQSPWSPGLKHSFAVIWMNLTKIESGGPGGSRTPKAFAAVLQTVGLATCPLPTQRGVNLATGYRTRFPFGRRSA